MGLSNKLRKISNEFKNAYHNGLNFIQCALRFNLEVRNYFINNNLRHIVKDPSLIESSHSAIIKNKFRKRYASQLQALSDKDDNWTKEKMPKIIWWCWLQGEENAPDMTKKCLASLRKNLPDYEIKIITWDNLNKYVELPKIIFQKFKSGWILGAHFSDILRLALLAKYGGIWIDSTVFCTDDRLIRAIEKKNMFMYQNIMTSNSNVIKMSNWLIASKKNNPYIIECSKLLTEYYVKSNFTEDYFVCHIIMSLFSEKYSDIWNDMDVYNNINPHMMQYMMNKPYNEDLFNRILDKSSFHKLNHHIKLTDGDTFYHHLIERG